MPMKDNVPALTRALDVLERLALAAEGLGYSELRAATRVPPASLTRILGVLAGRGYLSRSPQGRYKLGLRLYALGAVAGEQLEILNVARPILAGLRDRIQETVELGVPDGDELVIAAKLECDRSIRLFSRVGYRFGRLHTSGSGKALLAFSGDGFAERYIAGADWSPVTRRSITKPATLVRELDAARREGYAWDDGEVREDVRRFAAPVFDATGALAAVVTLAGPAFRMPLKRGPEFGRAVALTAGELSKALGYGAFGKEGCQVSGVSEARPGPEGSFPGKGFRLARRSARA